MKEVGVIRSSKYYLQGIGILMGVLSCVLVIFLAHQHLVPADSTFNPAQSCTSPPTQCWDGFSKPHYKCMTYKKPTILRSGVIAAQDSRNCYKSIYFNIDSTAMSMMVWFLVWAIVTSRVVETLVMAVINRTVRKRFAVAVLLGIPNVWYACAIPIHYLNDRFFPYFWSQIFFSVTELISFTLCGLNLANDKQHHQNLNFVLAGTSAAHIIQLLFDENFIIFGGLIAALRNIMLLIGDLSACYAAWGLVKSASKAHLIVLGIALGELLLFHSIFADEASFSYSL
jgi:hypothetical protein